MWDDIKQNWTFILLGLTVGIILMVVLVQLDIGGLGKGQVRSGSDATIAPQPENIIPESIIAEPIAITEGPDAAAPTGIPSGQKGQLGATTDPGTTGGGSTSGGTPATTDPVIPQDPSNASSITFTVAPPTIDPTKGEKVKFTYIATNIQKVEVAIFNSTNMTVKVFSKEITLNPDTKAQTGTIEWDGTQNNEVFPDGTYKYAILGKNSLKTFGTTVGNIEIKHSPLLTDFSMQGSASQNQLIPYNTAISGGLSNSSAQTINLGTSGGTPATTDPKTQAQIQELTDQLAALQKALDDAKAGTGTTDPATQEQIKNLTDQLAALATQLAEATNAKLQDATQLNSQIEGLKKQLSELTGGKTTDSATQEQIKNLTAQLAALQKALDDAKAGTGTTDPKTQAQIQDLTDKLAALQKALDDAKAGTGTTDTSTTPPTLGTPYAADYTDSGTDNKCATNGAYTADGLKKCVSGKWVAVVTDPTKTIKKSTTDPDSKTGTDNKKIGSSITGQVTGSIKITKLDAFPKGFNPLLNDTKITYKLSAAAKVELKITDSAGITIVTLIDNQEIDNAEHFIWWDGTNTKDKGGTAVKGGTYSYKLTAFNPVSGKIEDSKSGQLTAIVPIAQDFEGATQGTTQGATQGTTQETAAQVAAKMSVQNASSGVTAGTGPEALIYLLLPALGLAYGKYKKH